MSIRDQIIAHSDASKLHCRVGFGHGSFDELGASFVMASEARIVSLLGTDDIEVIQRYLVHFEACERLLDKRADTALAELLAAAVDFPENIPGEVGSAQTARVTLENLRLNMMVPVADFFSRHPAPTPRLIIGDDGYVYRQLVKLVRRSGKFVLQTKNGPVSMELATEPIKPSDASC